MGFFTKRPFWPENKLKSRLTKYYLFLSFLISGLSLLSLIIIATLFESRLSLTLRNLNNGGLMDETFPVLQSSIRVFTLIVILYIITATALSLLVTEIFVTKICNPVQKIRLQIEKLKSGSATEPIDVSGYQVFHDLIRETNRLSESLSKR